MRLALGTVQFGKEYGLANPEGRVSYEEVAKILKYASANEIDMLDTAAAYGESESVLGSVGVSEWSIITKIAPMDDSVVDVETWVLNQVNESMQRLKVNHLYGVLLHRPKDILGDKGCKYKKALSRLKDAGVIDKIGYSIYSPAELDELAKVMWPDIVQTPYNVFDQRIRTSGWLDTFASSGTLVHARSVFLQGLLLIRSERRNPYFSKWHEVLSKWDSLLNRSKLSAHAIALNYVLNDTRIDKVIVGVDGSSQLEELVDAIDPSAFYDCSEIACNDLELLEPYRWKLS